MLKSISLLLILAGLLMGPGYWIYVVYFTGRTAQTLTLTPDGQGGWTSAAFRLSPDMGAVGLILTASGGFSPNMEENRPPRDRYQATLYHGDQAASPIWLDFSAGSVANSNPQFRERLVLMSNPQDMSYRLELNPAAPPQITLDRVELQLRVDVRQTDNRVVAAGIILIAVGVLALLM
ncbi:MAG: hypothetical protein MUC79_00305 [Thiobacillaceae bacterium]|jgi:hypothetical protein|nr:hypothetical protein [Thiobacillaceae bacterium]